MKYIDNQDGTITDTSTGLMWKQNPETDLYSFDKTLKIKSNFLKYNNWRMPTIHELFGLVDITKTNPAINPMFNYTGTYFWSASPYVDDSDYAWYIDFNDDYAYYDYKRSMYHVRLVRYP